MSFRSEEIAEALEENLSLACLPTTLAEQRKAEFFFIKVKHFRIRRSPRKSNRTIAD